MKFASPATGRKSSGRAKGTGFGQPGSGRQPGRNTGGGFAIAPGGKAKQPHQETGLTRRKK